MHGSGILTEITRQSEEWFWNLTVKKVVTVFRASIEKAEAVIKGCRTGTYRSIGSTTGLNERKGKSWLEQTLWTQMQKSSNWFTQSLSTTNWSVLTEKKWNSVGEQRCKVEFNTNCGEVREETAWFMVCWGRQHEIKEDHATDLDYWNNNDEKSDWTKAIKEKLWTIWEEAWTKLQAADLARKKAVQWIFLISWMSLRTTSKGSFDCVPKRAIVWRKNKDTRLFIFELNSRAVFKKNSRRLSVFRFSLPNLPQFWSSNFRRRGNKR